MAKRVRKPVLSDPAADALEVVEQATAEEAEILSDLDAAAKIRNRRRRRPQREKPRALYAIASNAYSNSRTACITLRCTSPDRIGAHVRFAIDGTTLDPPATTLDPRRYGAANGESSRSRV